MSERDERNADAFFAALRQMGPAPAASAPGDTRVIVVAPKEPVKPEADAG